MTVMTTSITCGNGNKRRLDRLPSSLYHQWVEKSKGGIAMF